MGKPVQARAYAKVNLALAVGPPLPASAGPHAGYHPICSWFSAIDLWEDLEIEALAEPGGIEPSRYDIEWAADAPRISPIDWPVEKDLAVRAHRLLETEIGRALPIRMSLKKRVPVGGGLGGGSSDGATALRAIVELFDLRVPMPRLIELSKKLGSDVAFFLDDEASGTPGLLQPPRPAIVSGLGDRIERVEPVEGHLLLAVPGFGCPTGPVYKAFDASSPVPLQERRIRELVAKSVYDRGIDPSGLFNDLTAPAEAVAPELRAVAGRVCEATLAIVHLTGSGSTLFTLHRTSAGAQAAASDIRGSGGVDAQIFVTRLI